LFIDRVIQVSDRAKVTYSPIGYHCKNCGIEIHIGTEDVSHTSKPKYSEYAGSPFRHVICKCRWQRVHVRDLPKTGKQWISFWRPWSPALEL